VLFREDSTLTPGRPYIASKQRRLAESDLDRYVADAAENGPLITPVPPVPDQRRPWWRRLVG
jgi:hypothetical protein